MAASQKIQIELIKLLFQQIVFGLWAETVAAIGVIFVLWGHVNKEILIGWLLFNLIACGLARQLMVFFYRKFTKKYGFDYQRMRIWLILFGIGAFLSGISWGAVGSILMVKDDIIRQAFSIFLLIGVTSAANSFYSPNRMVYVSFLIPAFLPFIFWLFWQGDIYNILGILSFIYIIIMLTTSFNTYRLVSNSLFLRFNNTELVENLSHAKNTLEERTSALEKSLSLVKATLESTADGILVVDSNNSIEDFNQKFSEMWQLSNIDLKHENINFFISLVADQLINSISFIEQMALVSANTESESSDELLFKDGRVFERYSLPQRIGHHTVGRVWNFRDITERKLLEKKLFQQANFDILTGLPNRSLLLDRIAQSITHAKNEKIIFAILFLDLDRFKFINDTLGHPFGDKVLIAVATRLKEILGEAITISRGGGDEFIIILNFLKRETDIVESCSVILNRLRDPFLIGGHKLNLTVSFGISFYPQHGVDPEILIRNADIAMYHAKELGRNNFQFFTEEMNKKVLTRLVMENQLRQALEENEFSIVYQPILSLKTGLIVSLEALLRWSHPKLVAIPPDEFIDLAEETGVIVPIGEWVLRNACLQIKACVEQGFTDINMNVNLSARQFKQSNFLEMIQRILEETNLEAKYLTLELTESIIMENIDETIRCLKKLKKMGIGVVIDDFGTGYSSLNYLKRLPVDKLKIDRSFIQDIPTHADDVAITAAIIALANRMNLKVIAEGVEKQSQLNFLIEHHCDEIQGFIFSEPLDAESCLEMLGKNKAKPYLL